MDDEKVQEAIDKLQGINTFMISVDYIVKARNVDEAMEKVERGACIEKIVRNYSYRAR